jgi:hypothetical protein
MFVSIRCSGFWKRVRRANVVNVGPRSSLNLACRQAYYNMATIKSKHHHMCVVEQEAAAAAVVWNGAVVVVDDTFRVR